MFEKLNGFEVFIFAVAVCHPLTVLFPVIQVQHRSDRIHTQTIDMKFLNLEQRIGNQEIYHFCLAVIKNLCPPVGMFTDPRVGMLK